MASLPVVFYIIDNIRNIVDNLQNRLTEHTENSTMKVWQIIFLTEYVTISRIE